MFRLNIDKSPSNIPLMLRKMYIVQKFPTSLSWQHLTYLITATLRLRLSFVSRACISLHIHLQKDEDEVNNLFSISKLKEIDERSSSFSASFLRAPILQIIISQILSSLPPTYSLSPPHLPSCL